MINLGSTIKEIEQHAVFHYVAILLKNQVDGLEFNLDKKSTLNNIKALVKTLELIEQ